jgi:HEAT repeat protein
MPRVSSESRVSLRLLGGAQQADELVEQWLRLARGSEYESAPLGKSDEDPDSDRRSDEQLVQGARFEDLLAQLRRMPPGEDGQERANLLVRLSALMRLDPAAARRAQLAIAQGTEPPTARTLLGALGGAGSTAAQEALVQVGESAALASELRMNAVAALGLTDQPEEGSAAALQRLASDPNADVRSTAVLALGNTALAQRRHGQTGEAAAAVDEILARLSAAQTEDEQLLYLQALGNTGDPRALPALQAALRVPSVEVRKAAAQGLRFIPSDSGGTSPDQLLTEALRDPAAPVRLGALFAVSFRPLLVFLPALQQLVLHDGDEGVRTETVNLLGRALGSAGAQLLPGVLHTLKQVAERDPAPRVRKAALDLLNGPAR